MSPLMDTPLQWTFLPQTIHVVPESFAFWDLSSAPQTSQVVIGCRVVGLGFMHCNPVEHCFVFVIVSCVVCMELERYWMHQKSLPSHTCCIPIALHGDDAGVGRKNKLFVLSMHSVLPYSALCFSPGSSPQQYIMLDRPCVLMHSPPSSHRVQ